MCRCAAALARAVVEFLDAVLVGFFLSFFRPRPRADGSPPVSSSARRRRDPLVHEDRLGELPSDDERGFGGSEGSHADLADDCGNDEELHSEANYLKLIGTISETPAELQNFSYQINLEEYIETNALAVEKPTALDAKSPEGFLSTIRDNSPFETIKSRTLGSNDSPFPTPLVLREDMQTPGTVYTSHKESSGKRVRTRKQFVYPILRPIENKLQHMEYMELTEDSSKPPERRSLGGTDSIMKPQLTYSDIVSKGESPDFLPLLEESNSQLGTQRQLDDEAPKSNSDENLEVCSLSRWLKSSPASNESQSNNLIEKGHVFMASEANWDVENPTPRLSKAWDRHGIPNTTRKYREDQKVSWHSTPFEKRLLKVLSEEEVPPTRKLVRGRLFHHEERV
uniref:Protein JASON n=1 Tax=Leersia perrieri TaxID=77586 RepID=A0A0D9WT45_9ORYZ